MLMYLKRFQKDMKKYWKYTIYSAKASLKSEIANSYLNWLWWILDPLCFMLIYTFMFGVVFKASEKYFPVFIFTGITMWDFFNKNVIQSVKIVKTNKSIVSKVYLPKYMLLITKMMVNGFKMLISIGLIIIMAVIWHVPFYTSVLYAIPILITLVLITFGIGCYMLHYGVFVEDLSNVMTIVLRLVFYLTGIFYDPMKRIPAPYGGIVCKANPIAFLLSSMRNCVLYGQIPHRKLLILWFLIGLALSILGIRKIYKNENSYVKVI